MKDILDYFFNGWSIIEIKGLLALITLFGIIIGLLTFVIERKLTSCNRKSDNRKKWLIDIIISPEIENINKYFEEIINNFDSHINELTDNKNLEKESAHEHLLKRAEIIMESQNYDRIYIHTFVALIVEYNKNVGNNLKNLITILTDKYTSIIGNTNIDTANSIQEFSQLCNLTKAKFYRELYKMVEY
jgi:hypothetical protein